MLAALSWLRRLAASELESLLVVEPRVVQVVRYVEALAWLALASHCLLGAPGERGVAARGGRPAERRHHQPILRRAVSCWADLSTTDSLDPKP